MNLAGRDVLHRHPSRKPLAAQFKEALDGEGVDHPCGIALERIRIADEISSRGAVAFNVNAENLRNGFPVIAECPPGIRGVPPAFPPGLYLLKRQPLDAGLRHCLNQPDIFADEFRDHLFAICGIAGAKPVSTDLSVVLPVILSLAEFRQKPRILRQ